jgi:zinc protease
MYALDVLSMILSYGLSSRFEQNLVRVKGVATAADVYHINYKYGGSFIVFGIPQTGVELATLEDEVYTAIDSLKTTPVSDIELNKAKNQALAAAVYQQDSPSGIGMRLGWWEIEGGGWSNLNRYFEEVQKVSKADIIRVADLYLTQNNRTVGYLLPEEVE